MELLPILCRTIVRAKKKVLLGHLQDKVLEEDRKRFGESTMPYMNNAVNVNGRLWGRA